MGTFGERLAQAIEFSPYDQKTAAEKLGVSEGQLSKWVNDKFPPQGRYMLQLPSLLGVNGHWLLTGEGEPRSLPAGEAEERLGLIREIATGEATAELVRMISAELLAKDRKRADDEGAAGGGNEKRSLPRPHRRGTSAG